MSQKSILSFFAKNATGQTNSTSKISLVTNAKDKQNNNVINSKPTEMTNNDGKNLKRKADEIGCSINNKVTILGDKEHHKVPPISPTDYNPIQDDYDIVKHACWNKNEPVPYLALCKTFELIEGTSKRLEITRCLSNFLQSVICLSRFNLVHCVYLCLNKVAPDYSGLELGIGEQVAMKALAEAKGTTLNAVKQQNKSEGDLGTVALKIAKQGQRTLIPLRKLTILQVFDKFKEMTKKSGHSAQNEKVGIIKEMLQACDNVECKFLIRGVTGKLRIGLAEQTVLAALGQAITMTPPGDTVKTNTQRRSTDIESLKEDIDKNTAIIKTAYCECPNYDLIIGAVCDHGITDLLKHCSIQPTVPVKPMLAHPSKGIDEIAKRFGKSSFTCEYKYDGERAQIHVWTDEEQKMNVNVFSRNQEDNTGKYPDIVAIMKEILDGTDIRSCIIDSEAVAWNEETKTILPFQVLSTRKKKDVKVDDIQIKVCIYAFDLIYLNGESLVSMALNDRRMKLRESFPTIDGKFVFATSFDIDDLDKHQEDIIKSLEQSVKDKCEGLMIKTLFDDATYEISKRSHKWLKLKKDYVDSLGDSVDLVIIGANHGTGKRSSRYGTFLMACYDEDSETYQTICKLGTGFTDDDLDKFYSLLTECVTPAAKLYYQYEPASAPEVWFEPKFVWEVRAADLSISPDHRAAIGLVDSHRGISLRFPRFIRVREDKRPEMATTSKQIAKMYLSQEQVKDGDETRQMKNSLLDDDFY